MRAKCPQMPEELKGFFGTVADLLVANQRSLAMAVLTEAVAGQHGDGPTLVLVTTLGRERTVLQCLPPEFPQLIASYVEKVMRWHGGQLIGHLEISIKPTATKGEVNLHVLPFNYGGRQIHFLLD